MWCVCACVVGASVEELGGGCHALGGGAGEALTIGSVFGYKLGGYSGTELDEGARLLTQVRKNKK
jgi:hypothetical protein